MSSNVVCIKEMTSILDAQDDLLRRVYRARNSECEKEAAWSMMDALSSLDAHFKVYQKHYKRSS